MFEENVIYDIETFPNVFSCAFVGVSGKNKIVFEISNRVNQIDDFLDFLRHLYKNNLKMIGFNNLGCLS